MKINNNNFIVTGGGGGIGKATVNMLLENGAFVGVIDIDKEKLKSTESEFSKKYKEKTIFYNIDVGEINLVEEVVNEFFNKRGSIEGLINNAGIQIDEPLISIQGELKKHSLEGFDRTLKTNLYGYFYMGREVAEKMIMNRTEGVIVNVGSIAGVGHFGQTSYAASKGAVDALSVTWAQELAMYGIRVAGINPGMCFTDMAKAVIERNKKIAKRWEKNTPMKRMSTPEEMAEGIKFIIENDFFCGRMLQIDGGIRF